MERSFWNLNARNEGALDSRWKLSIRYGFCKTRPHTVVRHQELILKYFMPSVSRLRAKSEAKAVRPPLDHICERC